MPKKYLTVNEVARIIGITPLTVRNWDKKGRLTAHRNPVNNYRLYKTEEVEGLMKQIEDSKNSPRTKIVTNPTVRKLKVDLL